MDSIQNKRNSCVKAITALCVVSNMSQLPYLVDLGASSLISTLAWVLFFAYMIIFNKCTLYISSIYLYLSAAIVVIYAIFMSVITGENYHNTSLLSAFALSIFVFFICGNINFEVKEKDFEIILTGYIWSTVLLTVSIFSQYLIGTDFSTAVYAYASKNSISQIILAAIIFVAIYKINKEDKRTTIIYFGVISFMLISLMLLKSRATIIALPCIVIYIIFNRKHNFFMYQILIRVLALGVLYFVVNSDSLEYIVDNFILGSRDATDLNSISSGRMSEWLSFFDDIRGYWLVGIGAAKRESLILTALLEYGLIVGSIILFFASYPFVWGLRYLDKRYRINNVFILISGAFLLNGFFEQLAPFGPGVKCYILWLLFAVLRTNKKYYKKRPRQYI